MYKIKLEDLLLGARHALENGKTRVRIIANGQLTEKIVEEFILAGIPCYVVTAKAIADETVSQDRMLPTDYSINLPEIELEDTNIDNINNEEYLRLRRIYG